MKEYKLSCDMPYHVDSESCAFMVTCGAPHARPGEPLPAEDDPFTADSKLTRSNITIDGKLWPLGAPPLDIISQVPLDAVEVLPRVNYMSYNSLSFNSTYLQNNSVCQPTAFYQWGFSSLLLLVFCLFTIIFAITLTALNGHVFWTSRADRFCYDINHYKDAVDISRELHEQGLATQNMSAMQLRQEFRRSGAGICLDTDDLPCSRKEEWRQIRSDKRERKSQHHTAEASRGPTLDKVERGERLDASPRWVAFTLKAAPSSTT